ncbi:MAG: response regulator [Lachnospiraceae bacterium]|nr:response regulator [Lachnospiraceae bacterium]
MEKYCKVLIVDDEYIMRRGIRYMMDWESQGFQVVGEASNGKEALDLMEELSPHIVFCDITMPVMDGIDFIHVAHRKYPDVQILILSGYDKFEYVRQALLNGAADYILKPTLNPEELSRILTDTVAKIPGMQLKKKSFSSLENQLERFFKDRDYELKIQEFAKRFPHSCYRILGIPLRFRDLRGKDLSQVILEKAEQYLKTYAPGTYLKFLYSPEFQCVVFNYPLKDEAKFPLIIQEMMEQLTIIHKKAFAVLGKTRKDLVDLKLDFENTQFLEAEVFYHKGICLYEIPDQVESRQDIQKFDFRRFSSVVSNAKYVEAAEMFEDYIYKAARNQIPEFKLKNQTKNLLYNLIGSVDRKIQGLEQIRYDYFAKIDEVVYVEEFLDMFQNLMKEMLECLEESTDNQDRRLKEMLEYISEHYREEMDLADLAQNFNFNYSYLSTYFNTRMGEGFSEYLNRIRISRACTQLEKGELSISVISDMVGYSDQSYFCRVFKKITGETPSAYRRGNKAVK